MIVDLHTHSTASDGQLTPVELLDRLHRHEVELASITDHDTVRAYADLPRLPGIDVVPGIELSSTWNGRTIHVVGLNIDLDSSELAESLRQQHAARCRRAEIIVDKLRRQGLSIDLDSLVQDLPSMSIGRPHFAHALVRSGQVKDVATAFRKYLGAGKPGDVKTEWPHLRAAVASIVTAGGTAVLAHPGKYRLTRTKLRCLASDFAQAGGAGIELACGPQAPGLAKQFRELAGEFGFLVSIGSDFHAPTRWNQPGLDADITVGCKPIWEAW